MLDAVAPQALKDAHVAGDTNARALGTRLASTVARRRDLTLVLRIVTSWTRLDLALRNATRHALALLAT
jgi:hypothetical protein